jgi:thiosulfate/3-mercaptopyruvate sulfurtransferase
MKRFTSLATVSLVALILLCSTFVSGSRADELLSNGGGDEKKAAAQTFSAQFSKYFVTAAWVKAHLGSILLIDTRSATKYAAGHIAGAINVPSSTYFFSRTEGTDGTIINYMTPTPTEFIKLVNSWGVKSSATTVVTYGDADDADWGLSARLVWTLKLYGHQKAYNMDGGFPKWKFIDFKDKKYAKFISTTATLPTANTKTYVLSGYSDILAMKYDVLAVVNGSVSGPVLLDSRTPAEWAGTAASSNPRSGHIPDAVELTWTDVFDDTLVTDTDTGLSIKILKTEKALGALFTGLGLTKEKTIIPYCEGGFRSAHVTHLLLGLGYTSVRHYQGSWSEWSRQDPAIYPIVTP